MPRTKGGIVLRRRHNKIIGMMKGQRGSRREESGLPQMIGQTVHRIRSCLLFLPFCSNS